MQTRYLIVLEDGSLKGASATTDTGSPVPLDAEALAAAVPGIDAAALARVADLEAEVAELRSRPLTEPTPPAIAALGDLWRSIPDEHRAALLPLYGSIRAAVEDGHGADVARHVSGLDLPADLEPTRAALLALLAPADREP